MKAVFQGFLFRCCPPAGVVVVHHRDQDWIWHKTVVGKEQIPLVRLRTLFDQCRPIIDLKVDVEARLRQLLGVDDRAVVVERIVGRDHELDRLTIVTRFCCHCFGGFCISPAVVFCAGRRGPNAAFRGKEPFARHRPSGPIATCKAGVLSMAV